MLVLNKTIEYMPKNVHHVHVGNDYIPYLGKKDPHPFSIQLLNYRG